MQVVSILNHSITVFYRVHSFVDYFMIVAFFFFFFFFEEAI